MHSSLLPLPASYTPRLATRLYEMQVRCPAMFAHMIRADNHAAVLARTLVDLSPSAIGTMATVFPDDHALAGWNRAFSPSFPEHCSTVTYSVSTGQPFSLQEYYARCVPMTGDLVQCSVCIPCISCNVSIMLLRIYQLVLSRVRGLGAIRVSPDLLLLF